MSIINEIYFRETNMYDLELLEKMRVDFIMDLKPCDDKNKVEDIHIKTMEYLKDLILKDQYIGFIGIRNNEPICCAGLLIYRLPPIINSLDRVQGHLLSVFTYPQYRRMGYGKGLIEFVLQKARERNINRIFLNATKMGEGLYKKIGFFEQEEKAMILNL